MGQPTKVTVKQLIDVLSKYPDDMLVTVLREPDDLPQLDGPVDIRTVQAEWSSGGFNVFDGKGDETVLVLSAYEDPFSDD